MSYVVKGEMFLFIVLRSLETSCSTVEDNDDDDDDSRSQK